MSSSQPRFRPAVEDDRVFLARILELTETWGDPGKDLPEDFPLDLERYVNRWTSSEGGLVLEAVETDGSPGRPIGAAWLRRFTQEAPGYGFVSEEHPEVAIAVLPEYMGQGLGPALLRTLLDFARQEGHPGVSLSVEVGNLRALKTYEKIGFENRGLDAGGGAYTMLFTF